ncbi:glycoside hydrolase family 26 protein [Paenibacillus flagellatus]|uniref:Copper amine oxidase n=1 Tax=Paenibacillus flagellatus TaxID=2211139 RepID=A0A2V5KWD0_9BACL|nr:glycosyl hydrolase [Paenibacillus flagellatus]PYI56607.1 copper amine oxidase [Paenibacillus flagellatus]
MRRAYGRMAVVAGLLAAGCLIGWSMSERENDRPGKADEAKPTVGGDEKREAGPDGGPLAWWDDRLQAAIRDGNWPVAADYAARKAAYFRSESREKEAAEWYAAAADYWERAGETADRRFYDETPPPPDAVTIKPYVGLPAAGPRAPAKFEPSSGVYLGMFGIFDWPSVEKTFGRYHPIGLTYAGWRKDENDTRNYFPTRLVNSIKAAGGGAIQIGWEPQYGLDRVQDDDYVRSFARQAKEAGIPIFLRYASEMNGAWVPWYDEPAKYVEKFRLVARIMKEEAPNVAMVWSPNFWPNDNIDPYYPGDEYVDWVGFSLYSTPFFAGTEDFSKNQIDYFVPLYEKYAHKPIMIAEGAVSHLYRKTNASYAKWAEGQIGNMYGFLPRMFPQVKAITYFNMSKARTESLNGDHVYDMKENPLMFDMYRRLTGGGAFLTKVEQGASAREAVRYEPLESAPGLEGKKKLFVYVKMPMDIQPYSVAVFQGERRLAVSYEMPWEIGLDFSALDPGATLTFVAYDGKHEEMARKSFVWKRTSN